MGKDKYLEYDYDNLVHLFNGQLILLVTVTEIETEETRSKLTPLDGFNGVLKVSKGNYTYYIGKFGKYAIALVQSSMGSMSASGSIMTVKTALDNIKSPIVIMIGIAFGVDDTKQNIGDVLISETIIPYELKRVGEKGNIQRGVEAQASRLLLNRFKNITTWEYLLEDNNKAKHIPTKILSGEKLIDNKSERDELVSIYPEAKGGEMEGAGVSSACSDSKTDWILVKGICDFADGKKGKDKKKRQKIAIESAVSLCLELFASETAFKEKGISPHCECVVSEKNTCQVDINDVLFEVYDSQKEEYYLERTQDTEFKQRISQCGIWVYGDTGSGKTNLILRNLIKSQNDCISITLGSCAGQKNIVLFNEILNCIQEKTKNNPTYPTYKTFPLCSKAIQKELESHYKDKEIIIYIDEIPIDSNSTEYKQFITFLFALINDIHLINGLGKVKFILSSIHNPINHISKNDQKIHQYLYFIQLNYWDSTVIESLIELIKRILQCDLPQSVQTELIKQANGSPRFIKKFFRNVFLNNDRTEANLFQKIKDTENELKQFGNG
jgi:nucleoside phosphorylase